jgi:hypothetical protein
LATWKPKTKKPTLGTQQLEGAERPFNLRPWKAGLSIPSFGQGRKPRNNHRLTIAATIGATT